MAESCSHDCQMALMSPGAAWAARSLGFCCGPARGCLRRHGRPPGAHGQRLLCPCSRPSCWLQLASAGPRPCGGPPAGGGGVAAPSRLSLLQCEQDVHRQSVLLSEEQEEGCEAGRGVRRVVVRLDQLRQMDGPPGLLLRRQRTQQTVHRAVETLTLGVSLRVVRRRSGLLDVVGVAQLFH